jgi:glycosyltransferase involved in cell wall biosynthesis
VLYPHFGTSFWDPNALEDTRRISAANFSTAIVEKNHENLLEFWDQLPPDAENRLGDPDIIHANNYSCPKNLKKAKIVYTLHDLSFLEHPEFSTDPNRLGCFNGVFDAANHADFVIAISNYSRNKFLSIFPHFPVERIKVIYPGSRFNMNPEHNENDGALKDLAQAKFWLTVCTLEPRKNLRRLLKAYSVYRSESTNAYPLVLAGGTGWLEDDLADYVATLDIADQVVWPGYVSDDTLNWLYGNCLAFIFPSLYEGFGLPVLEAMSRGAAVIVSSATSLPEVAGDAAHYVDPVSEKDITAGMHLLAGDEAYRGDLKKRAPGQAQKFSWQKSAAEVLEVYDRVAALGKRNISRFDI